jgi:Cut8, nuclear proteasome tether protein
MAILILLIATMDKEKLIELIHGLIETHPFIQEDIAQIMPSPTLQTASAALTDMEKKLAASYPYNKNGPGKDDYSFNRVRPALMELVVSIVTPCRSYKVHISLNIIVFCLYRRF